MKKYYSVMLTILVVGTLMAVIGWVNGGVQPLLFDSGFNWVHHAQVKKRTYQLQRQFKNINIDVDDADVVIQKGTNYSVEVQSKGIESAKPVIQAHSLTIKQEHKNNFNFGFGMSNSTKATILITVPAQTRLNHFKISSDDSILKFDDVTISQVEINSDTSEVNLTKTAINQSVSLNSDSIESKIQNSQLNNFELHGDDNEIIIRNSQVNGFKVTGDDSTLKANNTILTALSLKGDDIDMSMVDGQLLQHNLIDGDDAQVELTHLKNKLNYKITGDDATVNYYGKNLDGAFIQTNQTQHQLTITGDDVDATIK